MSMIPVDGVTPLAADVLEPPKEQRVGYSPGHTTGVGAVRTMEWTSDGYALAVGWENAWGVYSLSGRCISSSVGPEGAINEAMFVPFICTILYHPHINIRFEDGFLFGISSMVSACMRLDARALIAWKFWVAGNTELCGLGSAAQRPSRVFAVPFAKSTITGQQSPVR